MFLKEVSYNWIVAERYYIIRKNKVKDQVGSVQVEIQATNRIKKQKVLEESYLFG